jgi:hypothetical protein
MAMTETPQELIARLRSGIHRAIQITLGGVTHDQRCLEAADAIEASLAREAAETARCCRIITAARMGDIDGDFRSMLHFVTSGNQMLYVEAAGAGKGAYLI